MALVDDLVRDIPDPVLRTRLEGALGELRRRVPYGLVFEQHTPEMLPLVGTRIRRGSRVALRGESTMDTFTVRSLRDDVATCLADADGMEVELPLRAVVPVKRHGEPVFPTLRHVETVTQGGDAPHHVLIESENHSALQLLRWLYEDCVDCIYIDPPYNTGAKDWKYNNDYVDRGDTFRSSKWLSMMERRLRIARSLLAPHGILVVAIDEYEFAHLLALLEQMFRGYDIQTVAVQHNPRGGGGKNVSNTHEYAVFVVPPSESLNPIGTGDDEIRDFRRRGRGENNFRKGRPNSFFAIHVDPSTLEVKGVGPRLSADDEYETGPTPAGYLRIYPYTRGGADERAWRNSRESTIEKLKSGNLALRCTRNHTIVQLISGEKKKVPVRSVWTGSRYNAGEHGTNVVAEITGVEFPYPKSIYTVLDCLKAAVGHRKDALVLDFFAGSGTTFNAVALMNALDGGSRRCILVTNNEVAPEQAEALLAEDLLPGDEAWEKEGICRAVTFPRCRNTILGTRHDGQPIGTLYQTGETEVVEQPPTVLPLSFTTSEQMSNPALRKEIATHIGIGKKALGGAWPWYIAPAQGRDPVGNQAVLLNPGELDGFLEALEEEGEHIERVLFVPPKERRGLRAVQDRIFEALQPVRREVERLKSAADGLRANLDYFRLEFLDPNEVEIGACLADLLPTLWLMAGCRGAVPTVSDDQDYVIPPDGSFAVLVDEAAFHEFRSALHTRPDIKWVFLTADSPEAFAEMSRLLPAAIPSRQRVHLYRDYIDNFRINGGER